MKHILIFQLSFLILLSTSVGCALKKKPQPTDSPHEKSQVHKHAQEIPQVSKPTPEAPKTVKKSYGHKKGDAVEERIREEYLKWKGTRHVLGGMSKRGIDCSAFVQNIYKKLFDIQLPRTTKGQIKKGSPVAKNELQAGDLVFFSPPSYIRHVGIFLDDGEFVHVSKKRGVMISTINPVYWGKYYKTARRVLKPSDPMLEAKN